MPPEKPVTKCPPDSERLVLDILQAVEVLRPNLADHRPSLHHCLLADWPHSQLPTSPIQTSLLS